MPISDYKDERWRGEKFYSLTIIGFEHIFHERGSRWNWICRCDCGTIVSVRPSRVMSGHTTSCGCNRREAIVEYNKKAKLKHGAAAGGSLSRLYRIWSGMKKRCSCERCEEYVDYGGRGIFVCDDWKNDFSLFRDWAYKNGYDESLSLDRINVNGPYSPDNCRWTDMKTQTRNRRNNVRYEYKGEERTIGEISEICGIPYANIYYRINTLGWSIDRATTEKVADLNNKKKK